MGAVTVRDQTGATAETGTSGASESSLGTLGQRGWATALYLVAIAAIVTIAAINASGWVLAVCIALGVLAEGAVFVRVRFPYALLVVGWVMALFVTQMLLVPALFSLGVRRRNLLSFGALAVTVALLGVTYSRGERLVSIDGVDLSGATDALAWLLNVIVVVAVPYLLGVSLNVRRELVESYRVRVIYAEQERASREREAVLLERQRIASEAHDVLGHKLALISMQSGALEMTANTGAESVERQAARIGQTARDGMVDLRLIIGTLDAPDAQHLTPQTLSSISQLIDESRNSGAEVGLEMSLFDTRAAVPADVGRAGYRIVQEALTNAHRHAPDSPVHVTLAGSSGEHVSIEVRSKVSANQAAKPQPRTALDSTGLASTALQATGRGLAGLRERARSVGGSLAAEVHHGEFVVSATLPWPAIQGAATETDAATDPSADGTAR